MELSRQEYPALLTSLSPNQAVTVLNDRVTLIGKVNHDIADWLAERRRIEDIYAQSLRKLSQRRQHGAEGLGVFQTPWQSIVASCESLADSHDTFARRIEVDVEQPLREYSTKNREMQGISTVKGNLASVAKDFDEAQKKADKLQAKGAKADSSRLSSALSGVQEASQLWESQAPFVFEQLQALDENRVNHLRDALTQLQTHEVDTLERSRVTAASSLEAILNVSTSDEISSFVAQSSEGAPSLTSPRRQSRPGTSNATPATPSVPVPPTPDTATTLMPPPPTPSMDDRRSEVSSTSTSRRAAPPPTPEKKKGGLSGLRRLGTVMTRRKDKDKETASPKPEKPVQERPRKPTRNPLRRNSTARDMQPIPSPNASMTELADTSSRQAPRTPDPHESHPLSRSVSADPEPARPITNGEAPQPKPSEPGALTNGNVTQSPAVPERKTRPPSTILEEGTSGSAIDEINKAEQEAAGNENDGPQFKLNIRNEPIHEENSDAQKAAFSNMASTLRAQAAPTPRKQGTIRGRRDVRNTIFVPNPTTTDSLSALPGLPVSETTNLPASPFTLPRSSTADSAADTQSVRSSHSLSSLVTAVPKHPEMSQPGLNASVIETVSSSFHDGEVTKAMVVGELALVHNGEKADSVTDVIRLDNFPVLHKVAPNPLFVNQVPEKSGEYTVDFSQLSRTQVAFKYQVHLEDNALSAYSPVVLRPNWKVEPTQISVILNYAFNHSLLSEKESITLQNVVLVINIENAKALSCQSKPVGTFSKERNMIYWRLGEVTLEKLAESMPRLLARFTTEGEAKPGNVEARWEISGEPAAGLGSGLGISQASAHKEEGAGSSDPFADEGTAGGSSTGYKEVMTVRKLTSGTYHAN